MSKCTSFSKLMKRPHLGATRVLGYALTINDFDAWDAASAVWQARLTPEECAALAWASLRSLNQAQARAVIETVLGGAGSPLPSLFDTPDEAILCTGFTSPEEIKNNGIPTFNALSPTKRWDFPDFTNEVAT
ncbi:hypothetical protein [Thalassovita sp.]|uniref:hypothetical protein n=1 Tax=Thalassovita sp. TaxID=1979401 RepID=UPI0029DE8DD0|nr:hypothetical protein [Thalassovita sp.]